MVVLVIKLLYKSSEIYIINSFLLFQNLNKSYYIKVTNKCLAQNDTENHGLLLNWNNF